MSNADLDSTIQEIDEMCAELAGGTENTIGRVEFLVLEILADLRWIASLRAKEDQNVLRIMAETEVNTAQWAIQALWAQHGGDQLSPVNTGSFAANAVEAMVGRVLAIGAHYRRRRLPPDAATH